MRRAYLHIGLPKTGTTAVQTSLSKARDLLRENGILYPGEEIDHTELLATFHQLRGSHFFYKGRGIEPNRAHEISRNFLKDLRDQAASFAGNVLLSTEYMSTAAASGLRDLAEYFSIIGFQLVVVCYVRHPVSLAASSIQQDVKMGHRTLADHLRSPRWPSLIQALSPSLQQIGHENIIVKRFEDAHELGIARHILSTIDYQGSLRDIDLLHENTGLSAAAVFLADAHNSLEKRFRGFVASKQYLFSIGGPKFALPKGTLDLVKQQAAPELDWLEENFGIVLKDPGIDGRPATNITEEAARDIVLAITGGHVDSSGRDNEKIS